MSNRRKIWSLPLVLVAAMLLVGLFAATVFAQTPNVPGTMTAVVNPTAASTITYQVNNAPVAAAGNIGPGAISAVLDTVTGVTSTGAAVDTTNLPDITATFTAADTAATPPTPAQISFDFPDPSGLTGAAGSTYTIKLIAVYDRDRQNAATDNAATEDVFEDGRTDPATADTAADNDRDGQLRTTVTIHVPSVPATMNFQVDPEKVVSGEIISRVGKDRASDPVVFEITNLGPGTATVAADTGATDANVSYKVVDGNKIEVRSAVNNLAAGTYNANITIDGGDFDLDTDRETFTIAIDAEVAAVTPLSFDNDSDLTTAPTDFPGDDGIHYSVTIPETTAPGTGVLAYYVRGAAAADTTNNIPAESITGVIGGDHDDLFRVNNETMAIEYSGGGLTAGQDYVLRLTASGDTGLANRLIVGMAKISVADVDNPPTGVPSNLEVTLTENVQDTAGLVSDNTEVHDFAGVGSDPEGRDLTYSTAATGFDFDGTKLMVNMPGDATTTPATPSGIRDVTRGDNTATTTVVETDWPTAASAGGWAFDPASPTSIYPDQSQTIDVVVSDGVASNEQTIKVKITLEMNKPSAPKTSDLPDGVTRDDTTGDYAYVSDPVPGTSNNTQLLDLSDLVDDADAELDYDADIPAGAPLLVNDAGMLILTHVPRSVEDAGMGSWDISVDITDGYNEADNGPVLGANGQPVSPSANLPDTSISISVTINVTPRPSQSTPSLDADINENMTGEVLAALTSLDSTGNTALAQLISDINAVAAPDAVTYKHTGGTNGGEPGDDAIFSVDGSTGAIMLNVMQNADTLTAMPSVVFQAERNSDRAVLGTVFVSVTINNINEAPEFDPVTASAWVSENAVVDSAVKVSSASEAADFEPMATDDDGDSLTYSVDNALFGIAGGKLVVKGALDADAGTTSHTVTVTASDGNASSADATLTVTVMVGNANDDPEFVDPDSTDTIVTIDRSTAEIDETMGNRADVNDHGTEAGRLVQEFKVIDNDGATNTLVFELDEGVSDNLFEIKNVARDASDATVWTGEVHTKAGPALDYEGTGAYPYNVVTGYTVLVEVNDGQQGDDTLTIHVTLKNLNDNAPVINAAAPSNPSVDENAARGTVLGDYSATDADGDTVTYSIDAAGNKSFSISDSGMLMTLASLDADDNSDGDKVPCGDAGCQFKVIASDGGNGGTVKDVRVTVNNEDDSVSGFSISKANPIANISSDGDDADTALADAKTGGDEYLWNLLDCPAMLGLVNSTDTATYCHPWDGLPTQAAMDAVSAAFRAMSDYAPMESPYALPATMGSAPRNFVTADWGNWDTVLRIEVTAQSADPDCGNGNQCVFIDLDADSSGDKLKLMAFRTSGQENRFVAAVKLVEDAADSTPDDDSDNTDGNSAVYMHTDGSVAALKVDEEDDVEIRLSGSKIAPTNVEVENEAPEFNNFAPEHEAAFDDGDVDYTFTITDSVSGIPEPEDLPDINGDSDYMPIVALVTTGQCHLVEYDKNGKPKAGPSGYAMKTFAGNSVWCGNNVEIRAITDDRDFDEIDDGFEVDTKVVLDENARHFVTFVVCDAAGNCELYTPDENDIDAAFAEITIDTVKPKFVEARTGVKWDSTDSEYDDDRTFIQVLFEDLTALDPTTIEADDFVVEGHTVKAAHWFDVSDNDDDTRWGDKNSDGTLNTDTVPTRYAMGGPNNIGGRGLLRRNIRNVVFLELEDELAPDETPDVSVVPNGVGDSAGNEQDDGEQEADDWISPSFTLVVNPTARTPEGSSNVLAGDNDEVVINLSADERIVKTRPDVTVTYVNAPAGCVETAINHDDLTSKGSSGTYSRGEIILAADKTGCGKAATGSTPLGTTIEKVSNTEWTVTVNEPSATGYYNIHVSAEDRSSQRNEGSEGIAASKIATSFFERDGDVNSDDAYYFQGDRNLANPNVRVSGVTIEDTEPAVEFKTPLFVELDFTTAYLSDCRTVDDKDERAAKCYAESDEYAKDSFDSVTITSVTLNGTDITDSVKTTDNETFLLAIDGIAIGDHEIEIQATDLAGNSLDKTLSVEFEVEERDAYSKRLSPGWNLVSIPGEPADSDISVVFGSDIEVRTVYTYDPIIPGGWMVAVRESVDADWQGDLTEITARRGYWVLSDAIQDWEVSIPRLAGGAVGSGTPIQPPVIALYAGWNLVPVIDVTGDFAGDGIKAQAYLQSLDDGLDLARVLGFDTITNKWSTKMAPEGADGSGDTLKYGEAYWVFVRQAASLVPGN